MKKKHAVWYLAKDDKIIIIEAATSHALIILLVQWDTMFARDNFMYLGVL